MTYLSKTNLMASKVAKKEKSDESLNQLRIEPDGSSVGSDGHAIMAVEPVQNIPGTMPDLGGTGIEKEGIGIPLPVVEDTLRNLPKGGLAIELGYGVITENDSMEEGGRIAITTSDLNLEKVVRGRKKRKRFPEWKGVIRNAKRKTKDGGRIAVDRKALIDLLDAMEKACVDPDHVVFIEFGNDEKDGIILRSESVDTKQRVIGFVRPLETGGRWLPLSNWELEVFGRRKIVKKKKKKEQEEEEQEKKPKKRKFRKKKKR